MEIYHKSPVKEDDVDVVPKVEASPIEDENVNQDGNSAEEEVAGASTHDPLQLLLKEEECCDVDEEIVPIILENVSESDYELVPGENTISK